MVHQGLQPILGAAEARPFASEDQIASFLGRWFRTCGSSQSTISFGLAESLSILTRDVDSEDLFEGHYHLNEIEAVHRLGNHPNIIPTKILARTLRESLGVSGTLGQKNLR